MSSWRLTPASRSISGMMSTRPEPRGAAQMAEAETTIRSYSRTIRIAAANTRSATAKAAEASRAGTSADISSADFQAPEGVTSVTPTRHPGGDYAAAAARRRACAEIRAFYGSGRLGSPDVDCNAVPYARDMSTISAPKFRGHQDAASPHRLTEPPVRPGRSGRPRPRATATAPPPGPDSAPSFEIAPSRRWQGVGATYDHLARSRDRPA